MMDSIHSVREKAHSRGVTAANVAGVVLILLAVASGIAVAQEEETFADDFEDDTVGEVPDNWSSDNPNAEVVSTGTVGDQSAYLETVISDTAVPLTWTDGPLLDISEEFEINAVFRHNRESGTQSKAHTRFGIVVDQTDPDVNALLVFNSPEDKTILSSDNQVDAGNVNDSDANVIPNAYNNEWVHIRMQSDGDGTLRAKVWAVGTDEPSNWMAEESFDGTTGEFGLDTGTGDTNVREAWLDQIEITGQESVAENLTIETSSLLLHGESQPYEVKLEENNETRDVTDEATVTSQNTSVIVVNESSNRLEATDNEAVAQRVTIQAEHDNVTGAAFKEVTVATVDVENLEVLPPVYRIGAFLGDWTIFLLIVTTGAGIIGTRGASAFMGLSMAEMVLVIGWFGGYISTGLAMTSVFAALFIGLNLAANIDYTVRR